MEAQLPRHISVPEDVLSREVEQEMVLLNLQTECYYGLEEVGTRIWQLLTEHKDAEKALAVLLEEYDVDEATLRKDLAELIDRLVASGLLAVDSAQE